MSAPAAPSGINTISTVAVDMPLGTLIGSSGVSSYYAFTASGTFVMATGFSFIETLPVSEFLAYDVTNALQVVLDVETFNAKLGLVKIQGTGTEASTATSSYSAVTGQFGVDSITIEVSDFKSAISLNSNNSQIVSVGAYASMYASFEKYVATYFGFAGGFASLFSGSTAFDLPNNDFTNMYNLLNPTEMLVDASGAFLNELSGSITIGNISQLLRYAVDTNVFGNRDPINGGQINSIDPSGGDFTINLWNYGVGDGFMPGDLIFVPEGTQVTLSIGINPEVFVAPLNNPVTFPFTFDGLGTFGTTYDTNFSSSTITTGTYSSASSATTSLISRTLNAPLLIRLARATEISALTAHE